MEVATDLGDVLPLTPQRLPLLLPRAHVAQGLALRFDLAMMVHILADLDVLGDSIPLGPAVALLRVPLQPSHQATDDGQAGLPSPALGAGHGT